MNGTNNGWNTNRTMNNNRNGNNKNGASKKPRKMLGYIFVVTIFVLFWGGIYFLINLNNDEITHSWDPDVEDETKIKRTENRGTIISMWIMLSAVAQAVMKSCGASETMLLICYGFFMAAIIGFMGDQAFGTDEGYSLMTIGTRANNKSGRMRGVATRIKYALGRLTSSEFWRYIVTVFLDMFISMPLQSVIVSVCDSTIQGLKHTVPLMPMGFSWGLGTLLNNFDNILQSFVAFITFLAYANETRFRWAYPGINVDPSLLISTSTIKLATSIAAIVYLVANVSADFNIIDGVKVKVGSSLSDRLDRKMIFAIFVIGLLTVGSMSSTSFMNYKPSSFIIAPIQKYTDNKNFWNFQRNNADKYCDCEGNNKCDNPNCKIGRYKTCAVDESGNLKVTDTGNIEQDNSPKPSVEACGVEEISKSLGKGGKYFTKKYSDEKHYKTGKYASGAIAIVSLILGGIGYKGNLPFLYVISVICLLGLVGTYPLVVNYVEDDGQEKNDCTVYDKDPELTSDQKACNGSDDDPCYIPDEIYDNKCASPKTDADTIIGDTSAETPATTAATEAARKSYNQYGGRFVKKIDMGVYRKNNTDIVDKFETVDKYIMGLCILFVYAMVGIVLPFLPLPFVYNKNEMHKAKWYKFIFMLIFVCGIIAALFIFSKMAPKTEDLVESEKTLLIEGKFSEYKGKIIW